MDSRVSSVDVAGRPVRPDTRVDLQINRRRWSVFGQSVVTVKTDKERDEKGGRSGGKKCGLAVSREQSDGPPALWPA